MTETREINYCDLCKVEMSKKEVEESREEYGSYRVGYVIPAYGLKCNGKENKITNRNYFDLCPKCRETIANTVKNLEKSFKEVHNREFDQES